MTFLTVVALWGDDVRMAGFGKNSDVVFKIIFAVCLFFFCFELLLFSVAKKG